MQVEHQPTTSGTQSIVEKAYREMRSKICAYIMYKIGNREDAEDLTQEVFLRILECGQTISEQTYDRMIYTVARNLVNDYLRHYYIGQEVMNEYAEVRDEISYDTEARILSDDLARHEILRMEQMPKRRQEIYRMVRFEGMNVAEISEQLQLSRRSVENHLLIGRQEMRRYIKGII